MDAVENEALDAYSQIVTTVADKITPRVASVSVRQRRRGGTTGGAGSAVVLTGDGHLLTNAHVVTGVDEGSAAFSDGTVPRLEGVQPCGFPATMRLPLATVHTASPPMKAPLSALRKSKKYVPGLNQ